MADLDFERRLERLFAEAPRYPDAEAFAARVETRLSRGWAARRWVIGVAGLAGGMIGARQLLMSNVVEQLRGAGESARAMGAGVGQLGWASDWLSMLPAAGAMVWIAAGLAALGLGFVLTRVIEEI